MTLDARIREALESETRNVRMPESGLRSIRRRSRGRRIGGMAVASLLVLTGVFVVGRSHAPGDAQVATLGASDSGSEGSVVPDIIGMSEGDAIKVLISAGLDASVMYVITDAAPVGSVLSTRPLPGSEAVDGTVSVAVARQKEERVGPSESSLGPLARITEPRPDIFVGVYRDDSGNLHAVFNPGIDTEPWRDQLSAAVPSGVKLYLDKCDVSRDSLLGIMDFLSERDWSINAPQVGFEATIDPGSCSVIMTTRDLTSVDQHRLSEMFGPALTFDTSREPRMYTVSTRPEG